MVGYAEKTMPAKMTMVMQQFDSMKTADGGLTLGDLIPGGTWADNNYTLGIYGGANFSKKDIVVDETTYKGLFVYVSDAKFAEMIQDSQDAIDDLDPEDEDEAAEIAEYEADIELYQSCKAGWYLRDGGTTRFSVGPMNNVPIAFGEGVLINADATSKLTNAGAVNEGDAQGDIVIQMTGKMTMSGNVTPVSVALEDIIPGGTWAENNYTLGLYGGTNFSKKDVTFNDVTYKGLFVYISDAKFAEMIQDSQDAIDDLDPEDEDEAAEIAEYESDIALYQSCTSGWYLRDGGTTHYSVGAVSTNLAPGDGVLINADATSTITIPSALK
ncbi:MAG: hypothetical protein IJ173_00650 [Kiritimatiellae bacterium]|nr:hypothetical protein [Kiritimatiellia bacterium]